MLSPHGLPHCVVGKCSIGLAARSTIEFDGARPRGASATSYAAFGDGSRPSFVNLGGHPPVPPDRGLCPLYPRFWESFSTRWSWGIRGTPPACGGQACGTPGKGDASAKGGQALCTPPGRAAWEQKAGGLKPSPTLSSGGRAGGTRGGGTGVSDGGRGGRVAPCP